MNGREHWQRGGATGYISSNATAVLVIGILSLLICSLLGPVAWSMGTTELRRIDAGVVDPRQRGLASAGQILGIIATLFLGLFLTVGLIAIAASSASQ